MFYPLSKTDPVLDASLLNTFRLKLARFLEVLDIELKNVKSTTDAEAIKRSRNFIIAKQREVNTYISHWNKWKRILSQATDADMENVEKYRTKIAEFYNITKP